MPTITQYAPAQYTLTSGSSAQAIISASGRTLSYRDLASLTITTVGTSVATVTISDGNKTVMVLNYPNTAAAPGSPLLLTFDPPIQQSGNGNAAWTITPSANAYNVTAQFVER